MPKRRNIPYKDPLEVIKENNRKYNELLADQKHNKKVIEAMDNLIRSNEECFRSHYEIWELVRKDLILVSNDLTIAENSRADIRDYYFEKMHELLHDLLKVADSQLKDGIALGYLPKDKKYSNPDLHHDIPIRSLKGVDNA